MSVTPEIKTKFSLQGLREARAGFGRISDSARDSFGKIKKGAGEALKPFEKDVDKAKRSLRVLGTTAAATGKVGFGALTKSAQFSFRTIKIGSLAAAASLAAVGAAATKAARDSATEIDKIGRDSRRLGVSTGDLSVLNFAAEREGVNPEEVTKGIAKIGNEFLRIRQQIAGANAEFERMLGFAKKDATFALLNRDGSALQSAADGVASARTGSMDGINQRIQWLENDIAGRDIYRANPLKGRAQLQEQQLLNDRRRELGDLLKAQEDMKKSFGPAGEALFGLENYGLDVEKTSKGGVEGLLALGDAIKRVEDPAERLRYSILLFGEDAGPNLLNLLLSGREGMKKYREEAEKLGIVVSDADAKMAEAHEAASTNFRRSFQGLKMSLGRALLPSLTASTNSLTEFVTKNRETIASAFESGLEHLKNFAADVWDLMNGTQRQGGFRTEWLNTIAEKIKFVRETWGIFRDDVIALANGGDARWEWLDVIGKGIMRAVEFAKDLFRILKGEDAQKFPWLNKLRDDFMAFANEVKAWVTWFAQRFKEAWDLFAGILATIRDTLLKPIADLFGMDPTTLALFIGLGKISGLLGIVLIAVKGIGKALAAWAISGAVKSGLTGLAAALGAATGVAIPVAGAAGGMGAGTAVAAGAGAGAARLSMAGRAGALARGVLSRAALPVAMVDLGYQTGKGVGHLAWQHGSAKSWADLNEQLAVMNLQNVGERSLKGRHNRLMNENAEYYEGYWSKQGIVYDDASRDLIRQRMGLPDQDFAGQASRRRFGIADDATDMQGNPIRFGRPQETIRVEIDFNGKQVAGQYAPLDARVLSQEASRLARMGR